MHPEHLQPLIAYSTPLGAVPRLFMSGLPGAYIEDDGMLGLSESRLDRELNRLQQRRVGVLVSLVEDSELGCFAFQDIADRAAKRGIATERFRIGDYGAPTQNQAADWAALTSATAARLRRSGNVAFHCMAGTGRSGLMVGSLLVHLGMPPRAALQMIRARQPEALGSKAQVDCLMACGQPAGVSGLADRVLAMPARVRPLRARLSPRSPWARGVFGMPGPLKA